MSKVIEVVRERERERERESNNLEECKKNIDFNVSSKNNPNNMGCDFQFILRRNISNNISNNTQINNENDKTKTIENCNGAQCASVLQRTNPKNKGITLIALIITIIILLILAGVTIHFTLGENGILNNAKYASEKYTNSKKEETNLLDDIENNMDKIIQGGKFR